MNAPASLDLSIAALRQQYEAGTLTPLRLVEALHSQAEAEDAALDRHAWIHRLGLDQLRAHAQRLEGMDPRSLPLYGIPFAIKDNIDLAGVPTTAACPGFAYTPERSATVVQRLIDAGAIPLGKTNLDQFATGLVGARSPYGACRNAIDGDYVSGGSSSGSAVVVARGLASFSLGTDTAGSGRVPAMFNNLVGLKPSLGRLPATGAVPACRTLDTVSVFALTAADAAAVLAVVESEDGLDPYARRLPAAQPIGPAFRFGVPRDEDLQFHGDPHGAAWFAQAVQQLKALGGTPVAIDLRPLREVAELLYEGPWVAERYAAIEDFIRRSPEQLHPVTRAIIEPAAGRTAVETFQALYRLQAHKQRAKAMWDDIDTLVVPTAPRHYTLAEVEAAPIERNAHLGHYTNFVNLLDMAAVAVPSGWSTTAEGVAMPVGITLIAPAGQDLPLLSLAGRLHAAAVDTVGASPHAPHRLAGPLPSTGQTAPTHVAIAVCGAHLSGLPLNHQLTERGATLLRATRTAPCYRFYALPGGPPFRPGLVRGAPTEGGAIDVEVWSLPIERYGSFVAGIPAPLGIGWVQLEDGTQVQGFLCEAAAVHGARDITELGSWRRFIAQAA